MLTEQKYRVLAQILPGESAPVCEKCITADIRSIDQLEKILDFGIDVIYHLAGHASVPKSVEDPRMDFDVNATGTFNMLELARKMDLKCFLFTSTVSVLDPANSLPLSETAVCGPSAPYAAAKMAGEAYCKAYFRSYGVPARVARLFNVYGPGLRKLVVYDLICKLLNDGTKLEILGDGSQIRDFLFVDDVTAGLQLISEKGQNGQVYHLGSGQPKTIRQLIDTLIRQLGLSEIEIISAAKSWKGDMPMWYADISKVKELGFKQKHDLSEGITRTIEWIRNTRS